MPVLGICYGMQTMALQLGGKVEGSAKQEFGYARVEVADSSTLLDGIFDEIEQHQHYLDVWMSHGDKVVQLPPGFSRLASTSTTEFAAMADEKRRFYGVQFHPEVNHTLQGMAMMTRFIKTVCGCAGLWTPANIVDDIVNAVRQKVGERKVILGLSGGVDSSVVAALLSRAIGDQLTCVFVDNGLLRHEEVGQVMRMLGKDSDNVFKLNIVAVDAAELFLEKLAGVADPEQKRKIIGNTFIEVFDAQAKAIEDVDFLAQGTIYPDVIESAGNKDGKAHVIKSHHNVGGLPDYMKLQLIEPLRELFKDEVRFFTSKKKTPMNDPQSNEKVLILEPSLNQAQDVYNKSQKKGLNFKRSLSSSNLEVIARLTSNGAGLGILPSRVAKKEDPTLMPLENSPVFKDSICLVYRHDFLKSEAARTMTKWIAERLKGMK